MRLFGCSLPDLDTVKHGAIVEREQLSVSQSPHYGQSGVRHNTHHTSQCNIAVQAHEIILLLVLLFSLPGLSYLAL